MSLQKTLTDAMSGGMLFSVLHPRENCPARIPEEFKALMVNDGAGNGPALYDATVLLGQCEAIVLSVPATDAAGAATFVASADKLGRTLWVRTKGDALAEWLALIIGHPKLISNFCCLCESKPSREVELALRDIESFKTRKLN